MAWVLVAILVFLLLARGDRGRRRSSDGGVRRLHLTCDAQASRTLDTLRVASNASNDAEVIRQAVGLYDWAREQRAAGYTVGAFQEGLPAKEVLLPFVSPPEPPHTVH